MHCRRNLAWCRHCQVCDENDLEVEKGGRENEDDEGE
jgi:hypothetical protein